MRYIDRQDAQKVSLSSEVIEKNRYNSCYNRLYPLIKGGTLNFTLIAEKMGVKERRIREALWFRLGAGEVRQLFGLQQRVCYLCSNKLPIAKEPLCITCLERIDAINGGTDAALLVVPDPLADSLSAVLSSLPDPENLFPGEGEEVDETGEDTPFFLEESSLRRPPRYGFERVRPSRG